MATVTGLTAEATIALLALKASSASPAFTGVPTGITKIHVNLANVDNTSDANKPLSTADIAALALKAPLASPAFTGTPTGITKIHVNLANVDNTSDANKPLSTADIAALALKAPLASPAFTGTPTGITKTHVGLANVDNTTDVSKPVSTAQAAANALSLPTTTRTNLGSPTVMEAALIDAQATNKLWFYPPTSITFENSIDDISFTPRVVSDTTKKLFVAANAGTSGLQNFPKGQYLRITITPAVSYVYLNWLYMYMSTNGNPAYIKIEKQNANTGVWSTHIAYGAAQSSWPGHTFVPHATIPFNSGTNASHYSAVRVTIKADPDTTGGTYPNCTVYSMEWWGGYPAGQRTIYSWDENKNVLFPSDVYSTGQLLVKNNDSRLSDDRIPSNDAALVHLTGVETISGVKNFTAQPTGITKSSVGLANVDNTSDANKPVSTAYLAALAFKAPLASPEFTGIVSGITKAMVGLSMVDNTSDINKPLSTASEVADAELQINIDLGITAAQNAINTVADGKNKIYYQPNVPMGGEYTLNDTWFDTDDSNKIYTFNGIDWLPIQFGSNALLDLSLTASKLNTSTHQLY